MISCNLFKVLLFATLVALLVFATTSLRRTYEEEEYSDNICFNVNKVLKGPIAQDDPYLVEYVRKHHMSPPASRSVNYNVKTPPHGDPSAGQSKKILNLLKNKTGGFFVECGGYDGEFLSNTLYMERELGWTGLLIEADPYNVKAMKQKNRKAWIANTCLSRFPYPEKVMFKKKGLLGRISNMTNLQANMSEVQCIPLYTLILALNKTYVDYLSLDVEGYEISVLESIPFDKMTIKVMSVEFDHSPKQALRRLIEKKGFIITETMKKFQAYDFIAISKS